MYISIYEGGGGIELLDQLPTREPTSLRALWNREWERITVYASDGTRFSVKVTDKIPKKSLLRSIFFSNSWVDVSLKCITEGAFSLDELKFGVLQCIEHDDDILTQFFGREDIAEAIRQADSFRKIVAILQRLEREDDPAFLERLDKEDDPGPSPTLLALLKKLDQEDDAGPSKSL